MNFAHPLFLLLLLPLGALAWLRERKASRLEAKLPFPDLRTLRTLPGSWRTRFGRLPYICLYLGLALSIVALARPRSLQKGEAARARGIDVFLAIDTSGSMRALDFSPQDRMTAARRAAKNFVQKRRHDRIGVVAFGGVPLLQCPLTLDYAAVLDLLDEVQVGMTQTENTAIGTAIAATANHLKRSHAKSRIIILVTDGRSNAGEVDPLTAARAAASLGIKIYTIGAAKRGESMIPVDHPLWGRQLAKMPEDLDEPTLQQIAQISGGRYYRATSAKELESIYADIDQLEKSEIQGPTQKEYEDRYRPWLLLAMILISTAYGLQMTVLRTVP